MNKSRQLLKATKFLTKFHNPFHQTYIATAEQLLLLVLKSREIALNDKHKECLQGLFQIFDKLSEKKFHLHHSEFDPDSYGVISVKVINRRSKLFTDELKAMLGLLHSLDDEERFLKYHSSLSNQEKEARKSQEKSYNPSSERINHLTALLSVLQSLDFTIDFISDSERLGYCHWDLTLALFDTEKLEKKLLQYFELNYKIIALKAFESTLKKIINETDGDKKIFTDALQKISAINLPTYALNDQALCSKQIDESLSFTQDTIEQWEGNDQSNLTLFLSFVQHEYAEQTLHWLDDFYSVFLPKPSDSKIPNWENNTNTNDQYYSFSIKKEIFKHHLALNNHQFLYENLINCYLSKKSNETPLYSQGVVMEQEIFKARSSISSALKGLAENQISLKSSITRLDSLSSLYQGVKCYDIYKSNKITIDKAAIRTEKEIIHLINGVAKQPLSKESIKREYKKIKKMLWSEQGESSELTNKIIDFKYQCYNYPPWVAPPICCKQNKT
ncbi:MAG: hypothetical protein RPS47_04955 [Colwellia sp.]|jgi:hypothetical protein